MSWRHWDRAAVVHHPASGETHYFNLFSTVGLELLEKDDLSLDELTTKMAVYLDVDQDVDFARQVEALVQKFDELGLIEPCLQPE